MSVARRTVDASRLLEVLCDGCGAFRRVPGTERRGPRLTSALRQLGYVTRWLAPGDPEHYCPDCQAKGA